jgi:hypothetical protein
MTDALEVPADRIARQPWDPATPGLEGLLQLALEKGGIESVKELVMLYREENDRRAAREFAADFAEFQASITPVPKDHTANIATKSGARFSYNYAGIESIVEHVGPELHSRGFSFSWNCKMEQGVIAATCFLRHKNGHSISADFSAPIDASASMNETQKAAAALTYAKRQSLVQVLGITTADPDTDIRDEQVEKIRPDQIEELRALLTDTKSDVMAFFRYIERPDFESFTQVDYTKARRALEQKALDQRKARPK